MLPAISSRAVVSSCSSKSKWFLEWAPTSHPTANHSWEGCDFRGMTRYKATRIAALQHNRLTTTVSISAAIGDWVAPFWTVPFHGEPARTKKKNGNVQLGFQVRVSGNTFTCNWEFKPDSSPMDIFLELTVLTLHEDVSAFGKRLMSEGLVPRSEPEDASHSAQATLTRADCIATWNFAHLVGPQTKYRIAGAGEARTSTSNFRTHHARPRSERRIPSASH